MGLHIWVGKDASVQVTTIDNPRENPKHRLERRIERCISAEAPAAAIVVRKIITNPRKYGSPSIDLSSQGGYPSFPPDIHVLSSETTGQDGHMGGNDFTKTTS